MEQYATTSFSYSMPVNSPGLLIFFGMLVAEALYGDNIKNGNLKNTVSSGISRIKIFTGQCVVSVLTATIVMGVCMIVWVLCSELLLRKEGPVHLEDFLMEVPAVYLVVAAGIVSVVLFLNLWKKKAAIIGILFVIWFFAPWVIWVYGFQFENMHDLAMWFPVNYFMINSQHVNTQECITIWDTTEGFVRCILTGALGIIIFYIMGVLSLRRKDL